VLYVSGQPDGGTCDLKLILHFGLACSPAAGLGGEMNCRQVVLILLLVLLLLASSCAKMQQSIDNEDTAPPVISDPICVSLVAAPNGWWHYDSTHSQGASCEPRD
jgi:hypothetical protein